VQLTSQLSVGGGVRPVPTPWRGLFTMALRFDMLFGQENPHTFGFGPMFSVRSDNFSEISGALGFTVLFPATEAFPVVASIAAVVRGDANGVNVGALERVWIGARSYNYHSIYTLSVGVFIEGRQFPSSTMAPFDLVMGVDLDLELFALPVILGIGALRTPRGYQYR